MSGARLPRLLAQLASALYSLLWQLALPVILARAWWRGRREPGYRKHVLERLGRYATAPEQTTGSANAAAQPVIWIHAVSVGEARAAAPLIQAIARRYPGYARLVTCTTPAGRQTLHQIYGNSARIAYLPYDAQQAAGRFLAHFRPRLCILMETEIWPNLIRACSEHGIPVMLANARMSKKSARGYARSLAFTRPAIAALDAVCAQGRADARRLRFLGAREVAVTGNLKFDVEPDMAQLAAGAELRGRLPGRRVMLFASTREGEEAMLLDAVPREALRPGSGPLVVIVPRHPQRFDEAARLVAARGLKLARRSREGVPDADCEVFLGDSLGEMALYFALADVAIIGGSFQPLGGQNLIEACAAGVPVILGPHMFNFADATRFAVRAGAAIQVDGPRTAVEAARALLQEPARRARMAQHALQLGLAHRGATERHLRICARLLERSGASAPLRGRAPDSLPRDRRA